MSARGASHQMILIDWIAGFFVGRAPDIETVKYARGAHLPVAASRGRARSLRDLRPQGHRLRDQRPGTGEARPRPHHRRRRRAAAEPSGIDGLFASLPADSALRGAVVNADGALLRVLDALSIPDEYADPVLWADVRGAVVSGEFAADDTFSGTSSWSGPTPPGRGRTAEPSAPRSKRCCAPPTWTSSWTPPRSRSGCGSRSRRRGSSIRSRSRKARPEGNCSRRSSSPYTPGQLQRNLGPGTLRRRFDRDAADEWSAQGSDDGFPPPYTSSKRDP